MVFPPGSISLPYDQNLICDYYEYHIVHEVHRLSILDWVQAYI